LYNPAFLANDWQTSKGTPASTKMRTDVASREREPVAKP
jgi:hypothetical protein